MRLFDRVRGRLHPREQAFALLKEIQQSYVGLDRIAATAARLRDSSGGQVSVVCLPALSHTLLPGACARFLAMRPGVSLSVAQQESPYLEEWLAMQRCDLGLSECEHSPPGTVQEQVLELNQVAVLSPKHPLSKKRKLKLEDFAGHRFLSLAQGDRSRLLIDGLFNEHEIRREHALETQNALSLCAMASRGLGIGIVNPLTACEKLGATLVARPLSFSVPFKVFLTCPAYRSPSPLVSDFCAALRQEVGHRREEIAALFA
jgi:DNA-binding transcriptional LysR family regulator